MSGLTEWQNRIEVAVAHHELSVTSLFTIMRDKTNELQKKIGVFESIVKKVDADNLPQDLVWAWCDEGLYLGKIQLNDTSEVLIIKDCSESYHEPTHYIEQKDLIKLFGSVK